MKRNARNFRIPLQCYILTQIRLIHSNFCDSELKNSDGIISVVDVIVVEIDVD